MIVPFSLVLVCAVRKNRHAVAGARQSFASLPDDETKVNCCARAAVVSVATSAASARRTVINVLARRYVMMPSMAVAADAATEGRQYAQANSGLANSNRAR